MTLFLSLPNFQKNFLEIFCVRSLSQFLNNKMSLTMMRQIARRVPVAYGAAIRQVHIEKRIEELGYKLPTVRGCLHRSSSLIAHHTLTIRV